MSSPGSALLFLSVPSSHAIDADRTSASEADVKAFKAIAAGPGLRSYFQLQPPEGTLPALSAPRTTVLVARFGAGLADAENEHIRKGADRMEERMKDVADKAAPGGVKAAAAGISLETVKEPESGAEEKLVLIAVGWEGEQGVGVGVKVKEGLDEIRREFERLSGFKGAEVWMVGLIRGVQVVTSVSPIFDERAAVGHAPACSSDVVSALEI